MSLILVVEDSPQDQQLLKDSLQNVGYTVHCVSDGQQALDYCESSQPFPDAIIIDVVLPILNGYQLARILSKDPRFKHIQLILCSVKNQEVDRQWALRQGAKEFMSKPIDDDKLLYNLRKLLRDDHRALG